MKAPIVLFVYNRLEHTQQTVEALQKNQLASESKLYVFADGPKLTATEEQKQRVREVQSYIKGITGFKDVIVEVSPHNKGLANSVIAGVTKIVNLHGKVIVVEDDIVTHPFFLRYMNDCLDIYQDRQDIFMIGGFGCNIRLPLKYKEDVYVIHRACTWGWATWKECWDKADWSVSNYNKMYNDINLQEKFNRGGGDMFPMLVDQMNGKIDSWGIRWDYCMFMYDALCVYPTKTMCINVGLDGSGVHCGYMPDNYVAPMYNSGIYNISLNKNIRVNEKIAKEAGYFKSHRGAHYPKRIEKICSRIKFVLKKAYHKLY